jgi:serine/threonine-protein kinase
MELRGATGNDTHRLLTHSKAVGLVVYLLLAPPGAFQRRDRIVGLLWPEQDQSHARGSLRKTIHDIRSFLGDDVLDTQGDDDVAINHDRLSCDAVQLRAAWERGRLGEVVDMYKGDLMPGFYIADCGDFESWLEDRRKELHELAVNAAMDLARLMESEANGTKAGAYARKAARLAGNNERILRRCLIMLDRLGDRAGALQVYDEFAKRLRLQMDAVPSAETVALAEALRAGKRIDSTPTGR